MGICITQAGEALIASLQAQGLPLVIDTMIFANVPGLDPTLAADRAQAVPTEDVVHSADIPAEYRAFVNPNQVVYSVLLGSDVGDFTFNWQGLYCSAHQTLLAVVELPSIEKRANDEGTNTPGNNLTRNFMLQFTGAQALTGLTVAADVWQLDFTVRLKGIDERERLSNRDIYGRDAFLGDGWLLVHAAGSYHFEPGTGYVEGIRAVLANQLPAVPAPLPGDVYLDVCMEPQGSDVVTLVTPRFVAQGAGLPDYTEDAPFHTPHYCVQVAHVAADGTVTDMRPKSVLLVNEAIADHDTDPEAHRSFTTPPQFDAGDKPAPTAFVQRALGNMQATRVLSASTALTAEDCGKVVFAISGAGDVVITLPAAHTCRDGAVVQVNRQSTSMSSLTVAAAEGNLIGFPAGLSVSSLSVAAGEVIGFILIGTTWQAIAGNLARFIASSSGFGFSLGTSGYQKLPSGLIIQWGALSVPGGPTGATIMLPIAWPNAGLTWGVSWDSGGIQQTAPLTYSGSFMGGKTSLKLHVSQASENYGTYWFAIGH